MLIPGLGRKYEDGDTSDYIVVSSDGGTVQFTKSFKYLGSVISSDGTDDEDIDNRIACASKIFGSTRFIFRTNKTLSRTRAISSCPSFVLPVLLYGAQTWRIPSLEPPPDEVPIATTFSTGTNSSRGQPRPARRKKKVNF